MKKKGIYCPPEVRCMCISEGDDLLLLTASVPFDEDAEDDYDSEKVKQSREDWWNENVWEKDWGLSGNV